MGDGSSTGPVRHAGRPRLDIVDRRAEIPRPWSPATVWIAAGLNQPPYPWRWRRLVTALERVRGLAPQTWSHVFRNAAQGPSVRGQFWNGVVRCETDRSPLKLLHRLKQAEHELGRTGPGDRPADFDLLLWRDDLGWRRFCHPRLTLPHPRMQSRSFVLRPLRELLEPDAAPKQLRGALRRVP